MWQAGTKNRSEEPKQDSATMGDKRVQKEGDGARKSVHTMQCIAGACLEGSVERYRGVLRPQKNVSCSHDPGDVAL